MKENYYAVIMAGGVGSRFWPVSTKENPKQFQDMLGTGKSLIQNTFERLEKLIPKSNILIATNEIYKELVLEHLKGIDENQIVLEPVMRNTAPCILYSALKIQNLNKNALMVIAPSDHFIEDEEEFIKNIQTAFDACENRDILMTLGIKPSNPNTGFGYINFKKGDSPIKKVKNFTEKPDLETAKKFVQNGDYLWNAGIFIWRASSIIQSFESNLMDMCEIFKAGEEFWNSNEEKSFIASNYKRSDNISIDYGILEKADNVYVLPVDFGWNDLGTWGSLFDKLPKDESNNAVVNAKIWFNNSSNNIVRTQKGKKVIVQGLDNFIIVETEDTLMILPKKDEQEIKQIAGLPINSFNNN